MTKKFKRITSILCAFAVVISAATFTTSTANAQEISGQKRIELSNAYLKEIRGIELDVEFDKEVREYEAVSEIPATVDSIDIEAIPENPASKVRITGADNLRDGLNKISISVSAQSGKTIIYRIYAYKAEQEELSSNANLISIGGSHQQT